MIAGQNPELVATGLEDVAAAIESAAPGDLIAGRDVEVGVGGEDALEGFPIVVDVGEEEDFRRAVLLARGDGNRDGLFAERGAIFFPRTPLG
jgi:hypothetical protein